MEGYERRKSDDDEGGERGGMRGRKCNGVGGGEWRRTKGWNSDDDGEGK